MLNKVKVTVINDETVQHITVSVIIYETWGKVQL